MEVRHQLNPDAASCYTPIGREWCYSSYTIADPLFPGKVSVMGKIWWDDQKVDEFFHTKNGDLAILDADDVVGISGAEAKLRSRAIGRFSEEATSTGMDNAE